MTEKKLKSLHPKVLELRRSLGNSPIRYAYRKTPLVQPEAIREMNSKRDDNDRTLKQYFCIWGVKDDYGTVPIKGCFSKSINERGPESNATYKITALYAHSQRDSVGLPKVLKEDEIGLYGEVPILEGIQVCDELVIRHKRGVCNNGSYGFNYIWDKMEYDDKQDAILMKECDLFELSFLTIGSQTGTYGVRGSDGIYTDSFLDEDTEALIKKIPRKEQLELRSLIERHITLAQNQPLEQMQQALNEGKPKQGSSGLYDYLLKKLKQ